MNEKHYRILQISATKFRVQYLEEYVDRVGFLWLRKKKRTKWKCVNYFDRNLSTYLPGARMTMPGKWVPMDFYSLAEAESHIAELREGYPLVIKDPA